MIDMKSSILEMTQWHESICPRNDSTLCKENFCKVGTSDSIKRSNSHKKWKDLQRKQKENPNIWIQKRSPLHIWKEILCIVSFIYKDSGRKGLHYMKGLIQDGNPLNDKHCIKKYSIVWKDLKEFVCR
jgi:hypothetical protein